MKSGQEIRWHNSDTVAHTATSDIAGLFDTKSIAPDGTSATIKLTEVGTFTYHCSLHAEKTGTLTVANSATAR